MRAVRAAVAAAWNRWVRLLDLHALTVRRSLPKMAVNDDTEKEPGAGPPTPAWLPYTRSGDDGETTLGDFSRTDKANPRVAAYGDCEETAAFLGYTINSGTGLTNDMVRLLTRVQNDLIDAAADICTPMTGNDAHDIRISGVYVRRLERACDHFAGDLASPAGFVVPGGTATAALLFYAYTLARRAERSVVAVLHADRDGANPRTQVYLNRLGNLLLVLARYSNEEHGDTPWEPGLSAQIDQVELWESLPEEASPTD